MNHDCNEPYAESGVVFDENIKLWRFAVTEHHSSAPISHCPFCGDKLLFESNDMDAYRENERLSEEKAKRDHEELMRMYPSLVIDRDTDDTPEHNPLKISESAYDKPKEMIMKLAEHHRKLNESP